MRREGIRKIIENLDLFKDSSDSFKDTIVGMLRAESYPAGKILFFPFQSLFQSFFFQANLFSEKMMLGMKCIS